MRLLLVEDEAKIAAAVRDGLEKEGYEVVVERTGDGAFFRGSTETFDMVLLDLTLPGRDGLDVLRALRRQGIGLPVLVLSARDSLGDRVAGLDGGADDYLVKPFAFAELLARVRALTRRGGGEPVKLRLGELTLDLLGRVALRAGVELELTVREFQLLEYLMRHQRQVVSRESLARDVWKEPARSVPLDNVIAVHIARVRRKVDADRLPGLIRTIRGVGYMLTDEESS